MALLATVRRNTSLTHIQLERRSAAGGSSTFTQTPDSGDRTAPLRSTGQRRQSPMTIVFGHVSRVRSEARPPEHLRPLGLEVGPTKKKNRVANLVAVLTWSGE